MIDLVKIINEAINSSIPTDEELRDAAQSQRGIPESTMLKVVSELQKVGGSAILNDALEHIGDLAHRLQEPGGIGLSGAAEKIRKLNKLMFPPKGWMSLEQEIEYGLENNAAYNVKAQHPEYGDGYRSYELVRNNHAEEIEAQKQAIRAAMNKYLPIYVKAHEEHNQPITYAGALGKRAAMQLGMLDFEGLRETTRELTQYFENYSDTEEIFRRA
jgi:hypothetical protein